MKIAYLVNQYPSVSHSFIRREIIALEKKGLYIDRMTIRRSHNIVDDCDISEDRKTFCILDTAIIMILFYNLEIFLRKPFRYFLVLKKAISFGKKNERGVLRHLFYVLEAGIIYQRTRKLGISHIHSHFGTNSTAVALFCHMLGGPDYSFTCHGPEEFDGPYSLSLSEKIDNAKFIISITSFAKSQLMRWCSNDRWNKIRIVHCAVDDQFLGAPESDIPDNAKFVCVGRLSEQKGQLLLLEVIRDILDDGFNIDLVLAGDGPMRNIIESKVSELNLSSNVKITGWLTGNQVKKEIISCRALLLPSFAEGLPVVIMEALALNRPVISTYIAGIPELIDDSCGILIPAGDKESLKKAITRLLDLRNSELQVLGQNGKKRVRESHNIEKESEKMLSIFNEFYPSEI